MLTPLQIVEQVKRGYKRRADDYVLLDTTYFKGKIVKINDKNGDVVAILLADMPSDIADAAFAALHDIFPGIIQSVCSNEQKKGFYSLHLSYYNRYAKRVSQGLVALPTSI